MWQQFEGATVIDLAHAYERGMPVSPNHPAYQYSMMRRHGDMVREDGGSAANEIIVLGGHVGTHIDALGHVSHDGLVHGGVRAEDIQTNNGLTTHGIDSQDPLLCRGVLLDIPSVRGVDVLEGGDEVTPEDLVAASERAGVEVGSGDAVLIRTGWAAHWADVERFRGQVAGAPGPGAAAAEWLAERNVAVTGAETIAYEVIRPGAGHATLPAHRILLVEAGIPIIEVMDLTALAAAGASEFLFVAIPLKLKGATGSPVRPVAVLA